MNFLQRWFSRRVDTDSGLRSYHQPNGIGKAIEIARVDINPPFHVTNGDCIVLGDNRAGTRREIVRAPITTTLTADCAVIFRFEDALGFKHAYGAAFGEKL